MDSFALVVNHQRIKSLDRVLVYKNAHLPASTVCFLFPLGSALYRSRPILIQVDLIVALMQRRNTEKSCHRLILPRDLSRYTFIEICSDLLVCCQAMDGRELGRQVKSGRSCTTRSFFLAFQGRNVFLA